MNIPSQSPKEPSRVPKEDPHQAVYVTPRVEIESRDDGYLIRAEMPGVEKGGLEITVDNGELIILGRRTPLAVTGEAVYREIRPYDFRRTYELDPSIDTTKVSARMDEGVLTLTLPKAETVKPRKISVQ
jgi:HSP20 family protein